MFTMEKLTWVIQTDIRDRAAIIFPVSSRVIPPRRAGNVIECPVTGLTRNLSIKLVIVIFHLTWLRSCWACQSHHLDSGYWAYFHHSPIAAVDSFQCKFAPACWQYCNTVQCLKIRTGPKTYRPFASHHRGRKRKMNVFFVYPGCQWCQWILVSQQGFWKWLF